MLYCKKKEEAPGRTLACAQGCVQRIWEARPTAPAGRSGSRGAAARSRFSGVTYILPTVAPFRNTKIEHGLACVGTDFSNSIFVFATFPLRAHRF